MLLFALLLLLWASSTTSTPPSRVWYLVIQECSSLMSLDAHMVMVARLTEMPKERFSRYWKIMLKRNSFLNPILFGSWFWRKVGFTELNDLVQKVNILLWLLEMNRWIFWNYLLWSVFTMELTPCLAPHKHEHHTYIR